jgi:hypothetical protein
MIAVRQPLHHLGRRLLAWKIEEELLDVLDLQRTLLEAVLLQEVLD